MNKDQLDQLQNLQTDLFDVVMIDCDPRNWNGYNKTPQEMSREERGGRAFDLKNADKTLAIFARVTNLIDTHTKETTGNIKDDEEIEKDLKAVKKSAQDRLKKLGLDKPDLKLVNK